MHLVDIHCHLDHPSYREDLPDVLARAKAAGVKAIITQGVNHESNVVVLALAKKHAPLVKAALGLYPSFALNICAENVADEENYEEQTKKTIDETLDFIRQHKDDIVAIGEVGLDFKESDDHETQIENFKKVIALAKELKKPLIIHSRKAELQVIDTLEASGIDKSLVVMHCFCGKKKLMKRGCELGYMFSIPCNISRAQNFQFLAEYVPISQLLTETDGPYLPYDRDTPRSESKDVQFTVEHIARIKNMDPEEVANNIFMNYQRMF